MARDQGGTHLAAKLLVWLAMGLACAPVMAGVVDIPDPHVRAGVYEMLDLDPSEQLTDENISEMELLWLSARDVPMAHISTFAGLEAAANMRSMTVTGFGLDDTASLTALTQLDSLQLRYTDTEDISFLAHMPWLTGVSFQGNPISDFSVVQGMTQLERLVINDSTFSEVHYVLAMPNIKTLLLGHDGLTTEDCDVLANVPGLTTLGLALNNIDNIEFLAEMEDLTHLYLLDNAISDLTPLLGMRNLESVDLGGNPLNDAAYHDHIPAILANNPGIQLKYDPIPEPTSLGLMLGGMCIATWARKKRKHSVGRYFGFLIVILSFSSLTTSAYAVDYYWDCEALSHSWLEPLNWYPNSVPDMGDDITIDWNFTYPYFTNVYYSPSPPLTSYGRDVHIGRESSVWQSSGILDFSGSMTISAYWHAGYTLDDGTLMCDSLTIGSTGTGTFNQNGGVVKGHGALDYISNLYIGRFSGADGAYYLDGGDLKADNIQIGFEDDGTGLLYVTYGTINSEAPERININVAPAGVLQFEHGATLSGATLTVEGNVVAGKLAGRLWPYPLTLHDTAATIGAGELLCGELTLADDSVATIHDGSLTCLGLYVGTDGDIPTAGSLSIADADAEILVDGSVVFNSLGCLSTVSGSVMTIRLKGRLAGGAFAVASTDAASMAGLADLTLRCEFDVSGVTPDPAGNYNRVTVEMLTDTSRFDIGQVVPTDDDFDADHLFVLAKLIAGQSEDDPTDPTARQVIVTLADDVDNYPGGGTSDDMLLVEELHILPGGAFDVGGAPVLGKIVGEHQLWYLRIKGEDETTENLRQLFPGDADLDGDVDLDDFVIHKNNFDAPDATWLMSDFDGDRDVDIDDFVTLKLFFGRNNNPPAGAGPMMMGAAATIPPISDLDGDGDIDHDDFDILLVQTRGQ